MVSSMMRARITLTMGDDDIMERKMAGIDGLDVLEKSIAPEAATEMPRTNISVRRCDVGTGDGTTGILPTDTDRARGLEITIEAEDASSLRAALNSYLRWMNLAMETRDMASELTQH